MNQHRQGSIFYKVVPANENPITEVLCNLFKYKNVRDTLLRFFKIPTEFIDSIKYEHIDTQRVTEEGIPDIVIRNNEVTIYIENKVKRWTTCQTSQTTGYLEKLRAEQKNKGYVKMIYLLPRGYNEEERIRSTISDKQDYTDMFFWEDLLCYLEFSDLDKTNLFVSEFISHYRRLFVQETITISLNIEEMELLLKPKDLKVASSLLSKITKIMESAKKDIMDAFPNRVSFDPQRIDNNYWDNQYEKGIYVFLDGKFIIFYGLSFSICEDSPEHSDYTFNYQVGIDKESEIDPDPEYIERFKKYNPDYFQYARNGWYIAKFPNYCLAGDDAPKEIADVLIKVIKTMISEQ